MIDAAETETEVRQLLKAKLPKASVARVDVREGADSEGEASLNVEVVFSFPPAKDEMRQANNVIDEFRTWLTQKGDDRFPYFSFLTEQDKKELSA